MKYTVYGEMTISVHIEVEADSKEEARRIAEDSPIMSLCHQCASGSENYPDEWRTSGELDSEVTITEVEEA